jgi:formylmethanofuran dehydrogenase subunit B
VHRWAIDRQPQAAESATEPSVQIDETEMQACGRYDPDVGRVGRCMTGCSNLALHGSDTTSDATPGRSRRVATIARMLPNPSQPPSAAAVPSTCPFCGLLCDDVVVGASDRGTVSVLARGCALSRAGFARQTAAGPQTPRVGGAEATVEQAVTAAARILSQAVQPLIGGLATDVAGMRAAVELADRCGAVLDHANSAAKFRNLLAFQDRGGITTTLAEIRNRADVLVIVGTDVVSRFPRFFERIAAPGGTLFGLKDSDRRSIFIGAQPPLDAPGRTDWIACERRELPDVLGVLAALTEGVRLDANRAGSVPIERLRELVDIMQAARYGALVWAAADLDFAHAELTVQAIQRTLAALGRTTRFSGVPLGGNEAELTADAVLLWQVGVPLRTSFAAGRADYDPYLFDARRLLARREVDALLWISTLSDLPLPAPVDAPGHMPLILMAGPNAAAADRADVFFPIATPGVDHGGHLVRTDKVLTMRLTATRPSQRISCAQVLRAITQGLPPC